MKIHDLLTPDSVAKFQQAKMTAAANAPALLEEYDQEQGKYLQAYQSLVQWRASIDNFNLEGASDPMLLASLASDGFLEDIGPEELRPEAAVFRFKLIAPKVVDAFLDGGAMKVDYAFNSLHVCVRRTTVPATVIVPDGWQDTVLVNCEIFELPYQVSSDAFDDREKVHVYYLAGMHKGVFRAEPVYIGIGTGEAYGAGPAHRASEGRFRFYRYDIKDKFQHEYVAHRILREWTEENASHLPNGASIGDKDAVLLLGRADTDQSFMCASDPVVAQYYKDFSNTIQRTAWSSGCWNFAKYTWT